MKVLSFLIFTFFAFIPMIFFTSCQKGPSSAVAGTYSVLPLTANDYVQNFCKTTPEKSQVKQSKTSRFRTYAKVDLSGLDDSSILTHQNAPHYNINITVNNQCLDQSSSGFAHSNFKDRKTPTLGIQSYVYFHPVSSDLDHLVDQLLEDSCVLRASPNQKMEFQATSEETFEFPAVNDPYYAQQKHLLGIEALTGFSSLYNPTTGMNVMTPAEEVIIAVIDTGIDTGHADLQDNLWSFTVTNSDNTVSGPFHGVDAVSLDRMVQSYTDYNPYDEDGHGTHVAGLIGAVANNGRGVMGVMPYRSKIMGIKVWRYDSEQSQNFPYKTAVLNGARWARDHGAKVINLSMGTAPIYETLFDPDWEILFEELISDGVSVVLATGNGSGTDPATEIDNETFTILPAIYGHYYNGVVNVGATSAEDKIWASFSHFSTKFVEIAAPGTQRNSGTLPDGLLSTAPTYNSLRFGVTPGQSYASGTSQSAPQVAAAMGHIYAWIHEKTGSYPNPCEAEAILHFSAAKLEHLNDRVKGGQHLNLPGLGSALQELYP